MAEDIVGGLFGVNPAMYQQQQQQQVLKNAIAMQQLDPFQRAGVGLQQAGYNFAGALGGAMGGVDPQLQRISALNAISKQIDQTNPESMLQGAKMLADAGFMQEALGLAQYARKANSELALAEQRRKEGRAATTTKEIQNAEYAANLRVVLGELESGPQTADTPRQIALLKARLEGLPQTKEASTTTDAIKNAEYSANILVELDKLQRKEPTPEIENQIALLNARLKAMPQQKDAAVSANIQESLEIGRLVGKIDELDQLPPDLQDPVRKKQLEAQLLSLTKNTKPSEFGQILQDAGYIPGSEDYKTKMKEFANLKLTEKPEPKTEAMKNAIAFADLSSFKKGTFEYNQLVKEKFDEFVAKPKADATTNEIRNALAVADLSGFAKDTSEYNNVFKAELARLTTKPAADRAPPSVGGDAERISQKLYGKRFSELSQAEAAIVDAEVEKRDLAGKSAGAPKIQNILPGAEKLADVPKFRADVQRTIDSQLKVIDATDTALINIDDSIKNNNFASYRAAQVQFAKAIAGAGDLSTKELLAAGADPSLLGGTADYFSRLFSSTPTLDTQNKIRKTLLAIREVAANKAKNEITQQRKIAEQSNYPKAALDTALNFPQLQPYQGGAKASKTLTTQSGKTVTVTEE